MNAQTIKLKPGVTLKTYIWDASPELRIEKRPAVLVFPGGGYLFCSDREAEPIALSYAAEGFNAFVLRYTVKTGFEKPFEEAQAALKLIRSKADEWNIIPDKIAVCGFSAGGHLAAAMGTIADEKPNAMILGYPAVIGEDWKRMKMDIPDLVERVDKDTVPAFIFSTFEDTVVPIQSSISFINALNKYKVPFESHIFQQGGHGLSLAKKHTATGDLSMTNPQVEGWFQMSVKWLNKIFGEIEGVREKPDLNASPLLRMTINEISKNTELAKLLSQFVQGINDKDFIAMVGAAPFHDLLEHLPISKSELSELLKKAEKLL